MDLKKSLGLSLKKDYVEVQKIAEISSLLYFKHKKPYLAFRRALTGQRHLNAPQLVKLATYLGISETELINGETSKASAKRHEIIFEAANYKAFYNTKTRETRLLSKKSLFCTRFTTDGDLPLSKYLNKLEKMIY